LKVATVAWDVAQLYATFRDFLRLCLATLRDFIKIIANDHKTSIHMASFFFIPRPSATFCDLPQLCATCVRDFGRNYAKVRSKRGLSLGSSEHQLTPQKEA
jgi:CRP-like cAMP-binding protein